MRRIVTRYFEDLWSRGDESLVDELLHPEYVNHSPGSPAMSIDREGVRWVLRALRGNWNVRVVAPRAIVTGGPYAFIRHPNYLAVILEVAALPLIVGAYEVAVAGTLANAAVLALRIPFEEERLSRVPDYRATMLQRPRLIPRLRRR